MVWWVPPHCFVDVDIMNKESDEVAEEQVELKENVFLHGEFRNLAVLQGDNRLGSQRRAGHASARAIAEKNINRLFKPSNIKLNHL